MYACRGEWLKSHAAGTLLGDFAGSYSYARVLTGAESTREIADRMNGVGARYFLLSKRFCKSIEVDGGMELVYENRHAQLWRVTLVGEEER